MGKKRSRSRSRSRKGTLELEKITRENPKNTIDLLHLQSRTQAVQTKIRKGLRKRQYQQKLERKNQKNNSRFLCQITKKTR
jgi:hypothetical protein